MIPESAFLLPGIYGGDDGLTADIDLEHLIKGAKDCGQEYKGELFKRGDPVEFLARRFTEHIWNGDYNSTCQLMRTLTQLPYTSRLAGVTPEEKLVIKLKAFARTDYNTPIISQLIQKAEDLTKLKFRTCEVETIRGISSFWSIYEKDEQWPNAVADLTYEHLQNNGFEMFNFTQFIDDLNKCNTISDMLCLNCYMETKIKHDENTNINGEILVVSPSKLIESEQLHGKTHVEAETIVPEILKVSIFKKLIQNSNHQQIIDIGAGDLTFGKSIAQNYPHASYYSIEPTRPVDPTNFKTLSAASILLATAGTSLIILSMCLHHMDNPHYREVIEFVRKTKPGSEIFIWEHDSKAEKFDAAILLEHHKKYLDTSPVFYRSRSQILGDFLQRDKLLSKTGSHTPKLNPQCKFAVSLSVSLDDKMNEKSIDQPASTDVSVEVKCDKVTSDMKAIERAEKLKIQKTMGRTLKSTSRVSKNELQTVVPKSTSTTSTTTTTPSKP
jgi:hypothetical protein